jgi:hypothetical protein
MARKSAALKYRELHIFILEHCIFEENFLLKKYHWND